MKLESVFMSSRVKWGASTYRLSICIILKAAESTV